MMIRMTAGSKLALAAMLLAVSVTDAAHAGRCPAPGSTSDCVGPRSTDRYCITFRGGECARIVVDGDGDTDLDLFVYDSRGRLVAKDDDTTDYCIASFWVPRNETFTIVIENLGYITNCYTVQTN